MQNLRATSMRPTRNGVTWKEIQKDLSDSMNKHFFTREEGVKVVELLENLQQWNKLQQELILTNNKLIKELRNVTES